jgi:integrase/recombinase XerD
MDQGSREQYAVFCSRLFSPVNRATSLFYVKKARTTAMTQRLFDQTGNRKYLVARERLAFARAACAEGGKIGTFCLTLAFTGARISEVLALTAARIDKGNSAIVFESLKRRERGIFRAVPVPRSLIAMIENVHGIGARDHTTGERLWTWGRTTAWKRVKFVMRMANVSDALAMPKATRHAFGVDAVQNSVALNIVQRWMGHARIETTAIYADVIGREERALARRTWKALQKAFRT